MCQLGETKLHFPEFPSLFIFFRIAIRYSCVRSKGEKWSNSHCVTHMCCHCFTGSLRWLRQRVVFYCHSCLSRALSSMRAMASACPPLPPLPGEIPALSQGLGAMRLLCKERMWRACRHQTRLVRGGILRGLPQITPWLANKGYYLLPY